MLVGTLESGLLYWAADRTKEVTDLSVKVVDASGEDREYDDGVRKYSYKVEASGVLTILSALDDLKWAVSNEYSPSGWKEVHGTRFVQDTDKRDGTKGKAAHKSTPMQVF